MSLILEVLAHISSKPERNSLTFFILPEKIYKQTKIASFVYFKNRPSFKIWFFSSCNRPQTRRNPQRFKEKLKCLINFVRLFTLIHAHFSVRYFAKFTKNDCNMWKSIFFSIVPNSVTVWGCFSLFPNLLISVEFETIIQIFQLNKFTFHWNLKIIKSDRTHNHNKI